MDKELDTLMTKRVKSLAMINYWRDKGNVKAVSNWQRQLRAIDSELTCLAARLTIFANKRDGKVKEHCLATVNQINDIMA